MELMEPALAEPQTAPAAILMGQSPLAVERLNEELRKRQMDAEVNEAAIACGTADKFRVKSSPSTPDEPAKPERLLIFAVALVLGLIAGLTAVVMAQLFDNTVRGARDIREILDVTPLTAVPVIQHGHKGRKRSPAGRGRASWSLRPRFL